MDFVWNKPLVGHKDISVIIQDKYSIPNDFDFNGGRSTDIANYRNNETEYFCNKF